MPAGLGEISPEGASDPAGDGRREANYDDRPERSQKTPKCSAAQRLRREAARANADASGVRSARESD